MSDAGGQPVDYEGIWRDAWGDLQRYGPVSRHQRRVLSRVLAGVQFGSVLDVGCGEGSNLAHMSSLRPGARLAGVDVSSAAIERARATFPRAEYQVGTASELRGSPRYDLVTCLDVLEHVEDDLGLLRDLKSLSARWVLCMTVQGVMRKGEREIGHVRNYQRGELVEKMSAAGMTPVEVIEWGFPFYSPLFRSFVASTGSEGLSYGSFGLARRLLCHALYGLFLANSWHRGDKIFVLASVR
jgi:SAM-dependent methyltransferase